MDTRHPGFTTLETIRPEITMNINNATICPEITRIRLVQNLISHLVDNYPGKQLKSNDLTAAAPDGIDDRSHYVPYYTDLP